MAADGQSPTALAERVLRRSDVLHQQQRIALQRRTAAHEGSVAQWLDARIEALAATQQHADACPAPDDSLLGARPPGPLGELAAGMHTQSTANAAYPELEALDGFRQRWSALRAAGRE